MDTSSLDTDTVVVGAGLIGLACALAVTRTGSDVIVLERNGRAGAETSSHNSEVIHAGLYYPIGSLRGELCRQGRELLYDFATENGVAFERCGKLLVATQPHDILQLKRIVKLAQGNGVEDLQWLSGAEARALEPHVRCLAALHSPSTGIIDTHHLLVALEGHLGASGVGKSASAGTHSGSGARSGRGEIIFNTRVVGISQDAQTASFTIDTVEAGNGGAGNRSSLRCRRVINAAGLSASAVGRMVKAGASESVCNPYKVPETYFGKGHYYRLQAPAPFQRLIYPAPHGSWLGIHATHDLSGSVRFGPDLSWVDSIDYTFDDSDHKRRDAFVASIRRYWPDVPADRLVPDSTGVRPKLYRQGEAVCDFAVHGPDIHGIDGFVGLYGIESPGLTSSLAIGNFVAQLLSSTRVG